MSLSYPPTATRGIETVFMIEVFLHVYLVRMILKPIKSERNRCLTKAGALRMCSSFEVSAPTVPLQPKPPAWGKPSLKSWFHLHSRNPRRADASTNTRGPGRPGGGPGGTATFRGRGETKARKRGRADRPCSAGDVVCVCVCE